MCVHSVKPSSEPWATDDPAQATKLLEVELARRRAQRLQRAPGGGSRNMVRALSVLFLLMLLAAGFYALWRARDFQTERRPHVAPAPGIGQPR